MNRAADEAGAVSIYCFRLAGGLGSAHFTAVPTGKLNSATLSSHKLAADGYGETMGTGPRVKTGPKARGLRRSCATWIQHLRCRALAGG